MPKAERKRSNPTLKIEGRTFKDFEGLDRNRVIPFFETVEIEKDKYQRMDQKEKLEHYELYQKMYYKYYDSLLDNTSLRNKFDPGVIFGYVEKDYYEGKGTPVDTKPQGVYKTEAGTRVSDTTPMIPPRAAGGDNVTGSKSRKSKKRKSRKSKKRKSRKLKKSKSKRRSKK